MLDDNSATENSITVDPFQLQPGEAVQVGDAVAAVLRASLTNRPPSAQLPAIAIAGDWELQLDFLHGSRTIASRWSSAAASWPAISARLSSRGRSRRARRRHRPLQLRRALRGEQHLLPLRGPRQRRRDGRHRRARRRQRPEHRHRQPQPVRQRPLAGPPPRVIRNVARLTILAAMLGSTLSSGVRPQSANTSASNAAR